MMEHLERRVGVEELSARMSKVEGCIEVLSARLDGHLRAEDEFKGRVLGLHKDAIDDKRAVAAEISAIRESFGAVAETMNEMKTSFAVMAERFNAHLEADEVHSSKIEQLIKVFTMGKGILWFLSIAGAAAVGMAGMLDWTRNHFK